MCVGTRGLLLVVLVALTLAGCGGEGARDDVAAVVNGREISRAQVAQTQQEASALGSQETAQESLDRLIDDELVAAEAARLGLAVTDGAIERRLDQVAEQFGGRAGLEQLLTTAGVDLEGLRERVRRTLLAERLQEAKFRTTKASRADAKQFYDENRGLLRQSEAANLGQIVVKRQQTAEAVVDRITKDGRDFALTARQYSEDPESKRNWGRLGWTTVDTLPETLQAAVRRLEKGQISEPVQGPGGWYVFKLYGWRAAHQFTFAEVRERIQDELTRRRRAQKLERWLEEARAAADVTVEP